MGAWGAGPFENDGALDWAGDLDDAGEPERVQLVRAALQMPLDFAAEYLDRDEGAAAVAAAELVLAQIQGRDPGLRLEPPLEPLPTAELGPLAARAPGPVRRIFPGPRRLARPSPALAKRPSTSSTRALRRLGSGRTRRRGLIREDPPDRPWGACSGPIRNWRSCGPTPQGPEGAWAVATRRMREQLSIRTAGA